VVEKVASVGPANYPLLIKTNYNDCALLMKIKLEVWLLWAAIAFDDVDFQVDRMALDAICSAVPPEMISTLVTKPSAKEAWESIKTMRIGVDRVRKVSSQKLRREYEQLTFHDSESVKDFAMRLVSLANQLVTLGDPEVSAGWPSTSVSCCQGIVNSLCTSKHCLTSRRCLWRRS
jgi:hypothetical protein